MTAVKPALFLDRDGVINVDHAYVHRPQDFHFIDGIFDLARHARGAGYRLFVVTNQAGIARGYYTEDDFHRLTSWMCERFEAELAPIDKVYYCPYHAEHGIGHYKVDSPLRKPRPGMILQAAAEFNLDLTRSVLVGDMDTDIEAGMAAGVGRNLLYRPQDTPAPGRIARLAEAMDYLVSVAR
jgi:D-glycero-D-manno-heptose 1,7-bisphosphate phosphatase